jgi:hypothetical protein
VRSPSPQTNAPARPAAAALGEAVLRRLAADPDPRLARWAARLLAGGDARLAAREARGGTADKKDESRR